jgi:hypothetical protein
MTGVFSTTLKDAAAGAKLGTAIGRLDSAGMTVYMRAQLGGSAAMFDWTAKRESVGKAKAMHYKFTVKKGGLLDSEALHKVLAGGVDFYQAVVGTRLVIVFGRDARARLAAVAAGKTPPAPKNPAYTEAAAGAKGRDSFYYFDLGPIVSLLGTTTDSSPWLSMAARNGVGPIPLVFTGGGDGVGKTWTADLTLPLAAFTSIGALAASASQMGMGQH